MKILVDENIPLACELFGELGEVTLVKGRDVDEDYPGLAEFDALVIRSVTKVTPAVVDRAKKAQVIGTATIGTDHIDLAYIEQANAKRATHLTVFSAPGSNAESVADYVWYVLLWLTRDDPGALQDRTLGIIGHGNCGSRVARRAEGFGMRILRNDPPLAERDPQFRSDLFEETIRAEFVTCHVPLTHKGESAHPTHHMIDAEALAAMRQDAYLLNCSRGGVVDSQALMAALRRDAVAGAALDVFEGEPEPDEDLLRLPDLVTPHIAGYAVEAKKRGAAVIYQSICRLLGVPARDTLPLLMGGFAPQKGVAVPFEAADDAEAGADRAVRALLGSIYDIEATSRELKSTVGSARRGELFDAMRKNYVRDYGRRELASYSVACGESVPARLRFGIEARLRGFGVAVGSDPHFILKAV